MPSQHSREMGSNQEAGIVVPLELPEWRILKQEVQVDGTIRVEVVGINERAKCPHCEAVCVKRHDVRPRSKRDVPLRGHQVELVVYKRRFWCLRCRKAFTEPDGACGRGKRTTVRLREAIGKQACTRPVAHVAKEYGVGPRFVQGCQEGVAGCQLAKRGLSVEEHQPLPTPRFLGIDEFARRKGHRYDTILCDLFLLVSVIYVLSHLFERRSSVSHVCFEQTQMCLRRQPDAVQNPHHALCVWFSVRAQRTTRTRRDVCLL